jgi:predicted TIM-barrel fold metal-dependent hydrolase
VIVDAHHHIWRQAHTPWLQGPVVPRIFGDHEPIRRDYLIDEYLADAAPSGVAKSVYSQVNVAPGEEVAEVAWVQSVADRHGFPHAITGFANLADPDVASTLDRELEYANLRGIRQQLHWHEDPLYRFAARPDIMNDAAWRRGLREVARRGLVFELQVFPSQMADAARLARDFPDLTLVLMHAGMQHDRSPAGLAAWRGGMDALAACPNVVTKLSGLGTFEHRCTPALWGPIVRETVERFGPSRCMFGSNFPVEKLWAGYADEVAATRASIADLSVAEQDDVMRRTAERVYRI